MTGTKHGGRRHRVRNGAYISGVLDASRPGELSRYGQAIKEQIKASALTDLMFWGVQISAVGDLFYNGIPLVRGGVLCPSGAALKNLVFEAIEDRSDDRRPAVPEPALTNVWFSLALVSGGIYQVGRRCFNDIMIIKLLLEPYNPNSENFVRNLKVLQFEIPRFAGFDFDFEYPNGPACGDGVDRNDEIISDLTATIWERLNCPVTYCAYNAPAEWIECARRARRKTGAQPVAGFNVQCFGGGAGNTSAATLRSNWIGPVVERQYELGLSDPLDFIWPVYSCEDPSGDFPTMSPAAIRSHMQRVGVRGASIWNPGDVVAAGASPTVADYADGVAQALQANHFETVDGVAPFAETDWANQVHRINGATVDEAYDYALENGDVSYFFRIEDGATLVLPNHGVFRSGDAVFFTGKPCWGSACGVATGFTRSAE